MKTRIIIPFTAAGISVSASLLWLINPNPLDDNPLVGGAWIIFAVACMIYGSMMNRKFLFILKVATPSFFMGAFGCLAAISLYEWRENWMNGGGLIFPLFILLGLVALICALVVRKIGRPLLT